MLGMINGYSGLRLAGVMGKAMVVYGVLVGVTAIAYVIFFVLVEVRKARATRLAKRHGDGSGEIKMVNYVHTQK